MKLKKAYTFLYMPEDHGSSRPVRVPRWGILLAGGLLSFVFCLAILFVVGVPSGASWRPGGSPLILENRALNTEIAGLEDQVGELRSEIDVVYRVQNLVATAVNLPTVDAETFAAGVGGRGPMDYANVEVPGLRNDLSPNEVDFAELGLELDLMVRQARIQQQGFQAILDTLSAREVVREHIPSIRPTDIGWLSSRFGFRKDPFTGKQTFHRGIDFSVPTGTPVRVTGDGKVTAVQQQRGLGRVVKIDHGNGVVTVYAHCDKILVEKGTLVARGDIIARSGNTGRSTAPHLHYEIRIGGRPVNPLSYVLDSYASRD